MWLTNLKTYWRFLGNNKLYTLVTVLGFAVSLMFVLLLSIYVKQELSVDQFHEKKDRIYLLTQQDENAYSSFSFNSVIAIKEALPEVEELVRTATETIVIELNSNKIKADALIVDPSFFSVFSFKLLEGSYTNALPTKESAVISRYLAFQLFKDEDPIGKNILFDKELMVTVTGVMEDFPINTHFTHADIILNFQLYSSVIEEGRIVNGWSSYASTNYFLAKEGADLPSKADETLKIFFDNNDFYFLEGHAKAVKYMPLTDVYFSGVSTQADLKNNSKMLIYVLLTITMLILLVAILNYINLSVAQAGKRGKEAAMRKLAGCGKGELIIQFISESMILTIFSFLLSLFFALLTESFFNDLFFTKLNLISCFLHPLYVLIFILAILVIGAVSGIIPAFVVSRFQAIEVVKGSYIRSVKTIYSKILISFQYIVAIVLLICSLFIVKQTHFMRNFNVGVNKENILILENTVTPDRTPALRNLLESIQGVEKVSFSAGGPMSGNGGVFFSGIESPTFFNLFIVDSAFLDIYGIKVSPIGIEPTGQPAIFVSKKGLAILRPDTVSYLLRRWEGDEAQINGVIDDIHYHPVKYETRGLLIYLYDEPIEGAWIISIKLAANANLTNSVDKIKEVYSEFNGGTPFNVEFADKKVHDWYSQEENMAKLLSAFTVLTFAILLMGIFAMSLYYVRQREKEIALRKVNGATEFEIMRMLNYNFMRWILIAFVIAVPIAYYAMTKWLESFAYKTSLSWWVFALTGVVVVALSVVSISVQSWRAATANPIDSIKNE